MPIKQYAFSDFALTSDQWDRITSASNIIHAGGTVAFPTETVYGLGADATNPTAIDKIYRIKQRPLNHPLIVHIGAPGDLDDWAHAIPESAWKLAHRFWPGPLTLILQRSHRVPDCVTGGQNTVGIRMPSHPIALALLHALGPQKALAAPSANRFGRLSPTTAAHVHWQLGSDVDLILDGGSCAIGLESTIVSFHEQSPKILRPGGISAEEIGTVLNIPIALTHTDNNPTIRTSGSLPSHYAPVTPLKLASTEHIWPQALAAAERQLRTLVMTWSDIADNKPGNPLIAHHAMPYDPFTYGQQLYAKLHQFDQAAFDLLLIETPPDHTDWLAVSDRLRRAGHRFSDNN